MKEAKSKCHPDEQYISVAIDGSIVNMQALVEHTAKKIIDIPGIYDTCLDLAKENGEPIQLTLHFKFGCDGQVFSN